MEFVEQFKLLGDLDSVLALKLALLSYSRTVDSDY